LTDQVVLGMLPSSLPVLGSSSVVSGGWAYDTPYHGASYRRESMRSWNPSRGSADRDVVLSRETLRARARDLERNNSVAAAAVLSMTTNTVGTGIRARPQLNAKELGLSLDQAEAWELRAAHLFNLWAGSRFADAERKKTFYQLQDLALRTQKVAGNCFALLPLRSTPAWPFALCVKLLDDDRCRNPSGTLETDRLAGGIEVDPLGAPVAYHFTRKPQNGMLGDLEEDTVRVPAFGEISGRPLVLHLFDQTRPDQRLGVSWLSVVIEPLKQAGRYREAELMAAVVSGMYTVFVKTKSGSPDWEGNAPKDERDRAGVAPERGEVGLKYGGVVDLAEDEEVEFANPNRPNPNYEPFTNAILREIGAGLGIPYETILKYFSSSYTAARAAFLEGWKTFKRERSYLCSSFCQPTYETALAEFISLGLLEAPGFFEDPYLRALWSQAVWIGDAPGQLAPKEETEALKLQVDEQFKTRSTATLELTGGEYGAVVQGLAREKAFREEAGLPEPGGVQKTESVSVQGTDTNTNGGTTPGEDGHR